jgi:WD40 repeat protein
MKTATTLLSLALTGALLTAPAARAIPVDDDIYALQFSEDGKYLITGGSGGQSIRPDDNYTGGIKVWSATDGKLIESFGQQAHIYTIFGDDHGRVGKRRWAIHSFKDIVLTGSYPDGKVVLLPSSLGRIHKGNDIELPSFVGGYMDFAGKTPERIKLTRTGGQDKCAQYGSADEYIGPVVASDNGRYAAVVVNTCKAMPDRNVPIAQYDSTVHVMDLQTMKVIDTREYVDSGIYALGITNDGKRLAYVGRDQFAVLDLDSGKERVIETYEDAVFQIPRQFSNLFFDKTGSKLVSLHYIYDIDTGRETPLEWKKSSAVEKGRTSAVKVAPDLSYFVLVKPKRSLIVIGEDGLPRSYGKSDRVFVIDTRTGEERELPVSDSMTEGKRCVIDISPDSKLVGVACAGGVLKVFRADSTEMLWQQRNVGYKKEKLDRKLIQALRDGATPQG